MISNGNLLRIVHLTNVIDGRSNSGTARVAKEIILQLSMQENIHQTFVHFEESEDEIYDLPNSSEILIPIRKFPIAKRFFSFLLFWLNIRIKHNNLSYDVVHWHASRVYPLFFAIPARKVVITLHDANNRLIKGVNTFWTQIFYWNLRLFSSKVDTIIGDSINACENLVTVAKFSKSKVKCLYMSSNFDTLTSSKPANFEQESGYLLCVSRWQQFKNVETLVKAYAIALEHEEFLPKLVLVGKPVADYNEPAEQILYLKLDTRVTVLQDLTDRELAYLYDNALINISPSLYEGFGLSVLEGLKRGCPSIDHKFTSTSEISADAGVHVNMNSAENLSKTILTLYRNVEYVSSLKKQARIRAADFSWEKTVKVLLEYYSDSSDKNGKSYNH